ncbi:mucin-3A [Polymixia lowei]
MKTFVAAFNNLSSPQSQEFIHTLTKELEPLCKEAAPQNFKSIQVVKLTPGSVVAETTVEYNYPNNETQIQILNTELDAILTDILNGTNTLKRIGEAFGNVSVELNEVILQPTDIKNITDLQPFINCSRFAKYTAEVNNGRWQCVGPCKNNPDYCHQHGECLNEVLIGPTCRCHESNLEQYYGQQCDLFRWGPAFYGALFGSLAAVLLLITVVIGVIVAKRRQLSIWNQSHGRRLSDFEEDFFDYSDIDGGHSRDHNLRFAHSSTSEGFRPRLENVDTKMQARINRPQVLDINPR